MVEEKVQEIISHLEYLMEDGDVSKIFREKAKTVINILTNEKQMAVEKALLELEDLGSCNLTSYHRTQVWDVVSMLEAVNN